MSTVVCQVEAERRDCELKVERFLVKRGGKRRAVKVVYVDSSRCRAS